jgi:cytochrome bd-type quinol oxidase subunit 2
MRRRRISALKRQETWITGTGSNHMNPKRIGLSIVLVGFAALNGYCFYTFGTEGFLRAALANAATAAVFIDLVVALTMVAVWMVHDAAQRGATVLPYLLLTLFVGSMGPLIYLMGRIRDGTGNRSASIPHARQA